MSDGPADAGERLDPPPTGTTRTGTNGDSTAGGYDLALRLTAPSEWRMGWSPQLDGLRGIGTVAVMAIHFLSSFGDVLEGLSISVDLFFAMSGFLITAILLSEFDKRGGISIKRFYIRRALRLYPALLALLAVFTVFALVAGGKDRGGYLAESATALFYVYDFFVAWTGVQGKALIQLWTLSIEQQFYLVWPLFLGLVGMAGRRSTVSGRRIRVLVWVMVVFVVVLPVLRLTLPHDLGARTGTSLLFGLAIMRPDAVVLGCMGAMAMRVWPKRGPSRLESNLSRIADVALWILIAVCVSGPIVQAVGDRVSAVARVEWLFIPRYVSPLYNLGVLASAVVVFDLVRNPHKRVSRLFSTRPLVWLGERSYAIYIWHLLVYFVVKGVVAGVLPGRTRIVDVVSLPFSYALTILIAMASWRFVEEPVLRLKTRFGA